MNIVIIHGPKASGKTTNAELLKRHYGCRRIVDEWGESGRFSKLRDGDLALTTMEPPFNVHGAIVRDIHTAVRLAKQGMVK
jgi:nicotinamide riboside kinase